MKYPYTRPLLDFLPIGTEDVIRTSEGSDNDLDVGALFNIPSV